jgi:hypothetical protein
MATTSIGKKRNHSPSTELLPLHLLTFQTPTLRDGVF